MLIPLTTLPRVLPPQSDRAPQPTIPQTRDEREFLRQFVADYVEARRAGLVPPLVLDELRTHAEDVVRLSGIDAQYTDYAGVLVSNEVWREQLATVPFDRRLLLLPKCLRVEDKCPAPFDEFGLLCKQCGLCTIQDLQEEAERLGYPVLVAEGSAIVMSLIQTGKIDAIVGVSCLSVLERAFPYMESAAVPGVAIPLLQDDCKDTTVDIEWIWDVLHLTSDDRTRRLDLDALRREVDTWFAPEALDAVFGGPAATESERIGREWLASAGKRWRPFLTTCVWKAFQEDAGGGGQRVPAAVQKAAVAVECFHKASLIHDDIEDADDRRYGEPTLHARHGVPLALNVGDLLIGEGYRLLAECDAPAEVRVELMRIAAEGQRTLCLGQGAELEWSRTPKPLAATAVVDIFRRKTSPAFEVALRLGAALAEADADVHETLAKYSEALGIAYQVRDDLADLDAPDDDDVAAARPTFPLALAYEKAKGDDRQFLEAVWRRGPEAADTSRTRALVTRLGAEDRARALLEAYKEQAIRTLPDIEHASLKGLLRRVVGKIFSVEIKGWCSEFEARNAAGGAVVTESAG
ncbi:MAG TPA: polyprenyl synthetase family protein [Vicinamibacterales bacterium]|nr:polyprenyl synthetase family protein [Vicinamibacterales bacterium]